MVSSRLPLRPELVVLSLRNTTPGLAMCCVVEMEDALLQSFEGQLVCLPDTPAGPLDGKLILLTSIGYGVVETHRRLLTDLRQRGATVLLYIFDSWNVATYFYNSRRQLKSRITGRRFQDVCDRLCVPFRASIADFRAEDQPHLLHIPLGVDASRADGPNGARPITVLGYGRQPAGLTDLLSRRLNDPGSPTIFHHTNHAEIGPAIDVYAHRRHFWKLAQSSAIALAYDPHVTDPERFPYPILGQRWWESLAAGCVVMGRRPAAAEYEDLLDWPDATLELPEDDEEAFGTLLAMATDTRRLQDIRERNVAEVRARHTWAQRFRPLLEGGA